MSMIPTWIVDFYVSGSISVKGNLKFSERKGILFDNPFYSDIDLRGMPGGIKASITAFASTSELARKAAFSFFGKMLDVLCLQLNIPLYLSFTDQRKVSKGDYRVRRIVEKYEWQSAFKQARVLADTEPIFLRSLGWFRKGLYSEDPFDKFLAFWNSIEIVASNYHPKVERAKNGSKSQIWECFKQLWGECEQWPIITGNQNWIDDNYDSRKDIAHGIAPISIETIEEILDKLEIIEKVSYTFLTEWQKSQLNQNREFWR